MVEASRDEASLAVRLYNDPAEVRSFEAFVVHMHLAWLYLLHAEFTRDAIDFRYHQKDNPRLLEKIDGEPKRWELAKSVRERWTSDRDPVRANIEFFIGLRNKVEHRFAQQQQALSAVVGGQAQALLLNYEEELVAQFGSSASLATRLRFPVFIGSFTDEGERSLRRLRKTLPAPLRRYITEYSANLDQTVTDDPRFELRLRVFQELAPKGDPDALSVQYTRFDDMTDEQKAAVEAAGKKGLVVIKERKREVVGSGLKKPSQVVKAVQAQIPYNFTMGHFTKAWKAMDVRPPSDSPNPERTLEQYCTYDERHNDYGYKDAYVRKLIQKCATEEGFRALLGTAPKDKVTGQWVGEPPPNSVPPWRRAEPAGANEVQASA
ncbi:DUF3644 domain-containing protein [Modestobacter sp. VKM Ac-2984]|uniref:DUF3644 domain-containing protein n=1 Tax=Modestobacter sp. VKM Ac-2984 TaxID=3004138 RepID=UPI0022AA300D|nr:DUF3644 domain-containing protein [Modestobacter sp. VKM Ac-2984]MCZ2816772.1 DUF3644 domain-containing protein [Modestobacter sp. VKM Ac-2984]